MYLAVPRPCVVEAIDLSRVGVDIKPKVPSPIRLLVFSFTSINDVIYVMKITFYY